MQVHVEVDAGQATGPLELWRHGVGLGGINPLPLPERVVAGARRLQPRLIRIFIQEFFGVYPGHGRFDWSRLDPYMEALGRTGARVLAAITLKPRVLYPRIDEATFRPRDPGEWQHVVGQLVRRYSVDRPLVTHWEVGNEVDIGEAGGSPYLIRDGDDYAEYYALTARAILDAFPAARVGGPGMAGLLNPPMPGFLRSCAERGLRLDFATWHLYHSDPALHAYQVRVARHLTAALKPAPERMVTEWSTGFGPESTEDGAAHPVRAAAVARTVLDLRRAGLDASFYYHLWDQLARPEDFEPLFSPPGVANMLRHWNEVPHRFGLFSVDGRPRAQYFAFRLLADLGEEEVAARSDRGDVAVLAGRGPDGRVGALLVNHSVEGAQEGVAVLRFAGLAPGPRTVAVRRVDADRRWDEASLELIPVESRPAIVGEGYECQCRLPANSVAAVHLEPGA